MQLSKRQIVKRYEWNEKRKKRRVTENETKTAKTQHVMHFIIVLYYIFFRWIEDKVVSKTFNALMKFEHFPSKKRKRKGFYVIRNYKSRKE